MDINTAFIRRWVDESGDVAEVARCCGKSIETIGRWATGRPIPKTAHDSVLAAYKAWQMAQPQEGK